MPRSAYLGGGILKKLVIMTILTAGALTSSALAVELSINGNVAESLSASDNYFLTKNPSGVTAESRTAGALNFLASTPTTNMLLNANYSYYKYFGPGAADTALTWGTPANVNLGIDHTEQLTKYNVGAAWTRSDTTQVSLAQTGVASGHGSISTHSAHGGVSHDLNRIDSVSWTAQATTVSYTDPTQFPFSDVSTTARWNRVLSSTTTFYSSMFFDWFSQDDPAQSQRLLWKFMTGFNSTISPRLTFTGNFGWIFGNSYQLNPMAASSIPVGAFIPQVGAANGFIWDVALSYRLLKTTTLSLTAAESIVPLFNGQLQKSDQVALTLSHQINRSSNLSVSAAFTLIPATTGNSVLGGQSSESEFLSASINYSYQLAREWRTNLSYSYAQRNDNTGVTRSNTILFTLAHNFTLLGSPTALNVAEKERAKARARQAIGYVFPGFH